jgi:hypothetical protein
MILVETSYIRSQNIWLIVKVMMKVILNFWKYTFLKKQVGFFSNDFVWNLLYPASKHMVDRNGYDESDIQVLHKIFLCFLDAQVCN